MPRARNISGGGAQTNVNGLKFEKNTSLEDQLKNVPGIRIENNQILKNNVCIGMICSKNKLYTAVLETNKINYKDIISKRLIPDEAFLINNVLYIFEKKFQNVSGSVDEKLQTCDFKRMQYNRLFTPLGIPVIFIYVFNDYFKNEQYKDSLKYIVDSGCLYFFNSIPLSLFGLA